MEVKDRPPHLRRASHLKGRRSISSVFAPGSLEAEVLVNKPRAMTSFLNRWQFPVQPGCVGCSFLAWLLKNDVFFKAVGP